jgi:hypothetical protein
MGFVWVLLSIPVFMVIGILFNVLLQDGGCSNRWYRIHDYKLVRYVYGNDGLPRYTIHECINCGDICNIVYDNYSGPD